MTKKQVPTAATDALTWLYLGLFVCFCVKRKCNSVECNVHCSLTLCNGKRISDCQRRKCKLVLFRF